MVGINASDFDLDLLVPAVCTVCSPQTERHMLELLLSENAEGGANGQSTTRQRRRP
jgi:hypothetical protein